VASVEALAAVCELDQVERLADAGQHAERQHIDLHHAERVEIVLVPFDEGAVVHRGGPIGTISSSRSCGQHEAADMLRQMARENRSDLRPVQRAGEARLAGSSRPGAPALFRRSAPAPDRIGQRGGDVLGQAERLADLADGAARAIVDHGGGERGAVAAVAP
jgi:hypothetical protein